MKRAHIFSILITGIVFSLMLVLMTGTAAAQRPGRPTPVATLDRSSINTNRTPIATPNAAQPTFQRPTTGSALSIVVPTFSLPINLTLTPHDTLSLTGASEEAATVVNSFASSYLGTSYTFLYSGSLSDSNTSENWDAIMAQLPANIQSYITTFTSAAAGSYWGAFQTGIGIVAVGDCTNNPTCTINMDNLNVYLTNASAGVYSTYTADTVASAGDALNLIHAVYPELNGVALQAISSDQGYVFQAVTYATGVSSTKQVTASSKLYAAGVINAGTQALVYAIVGIGDGYVGMMN